MIDPIAAAPAMALTGLEPIPQLQLPLTPPLPTVSAADQARFQAALHGPLPSPASPPPVAAAAAEVPRTPGDFILRGLDRLRASHHSLSEQLERGLPQSAISPFELLALQMRIGQVTLGVQIAGQIASKLEQHVNSLLKSA